MIYLISRDQLIVLQFVVIFTKECLKKGPVSCQLYSALTAASQVIEVLVSCVLLFSLAKSLKNTTDHLSPLLRLQG